MTSIFNQGNEYLKVIADIIESELDLKPTNPASTNPNDRRVFIYHQNFVLPTYNYMLVILGEAPGKVISAHAFYDPVTEKEVQEVIMQKEVSIDVLSVNSEARQRKEEIIMALASIYSQQQQEANGFRIFSYPNTFIDVSEVEGAQMGNRYRAAFIVHARYSKEKNVAVFDQFGDTVAYN